MVLIHVANAPHTVLHVWQLARLDGMYVQVPVGVAVEQPGGDYAYGAPSSPQRGVSYVPPRHPAAAQSNSPTAPRMHDSLSQV